MDNQLFSGGTYLDDMPQVCTLCGVVLNNAMSLYSHMQLHILSSNLAPQPPDSGLALNPANILDLLSGVTQLGVPSSVPTPMLLPQGLFTPASSVPSRHLTPSTLDLGLASLQNTSIPAPLVKAKEKKPSKPHLQHSSNQLSTSSRVSSSSGSNKKHEEAKTSHSKLDRGSIKEKHQLSSKFDHPEDSLGLANVSKLPFQRQSSGSSKPVQESSHQHKDVKLFQPFMTTETSSSLSFQPKSNHFHTPSGLVSPTSCRSPDIGKESDVLNTPQKVNLSTSDLRTEDLGLLETITHTAVPQEGLKINKAKSQELLDSLFDKMKETPAPPPKTSSSSQIDSHQLKTQFYPSILDPMNISPKSGPLFNKRDSGKGADSLPKTTQQSTPFITKASTSFEGDSAISKTPMNPKAVTNGGQIQATPMISPKLDTGITGKTDAISNIIEPSSQTSIHPPVFGNAPSTSGIPPVGIAPLRSTSPPVLGHTDHTKNPLGTGFFNALTQKLINPGLPVCTDFAKTPSASAVNFGGDPSSKGYYENGVLLNHDYDKISDTNDEDDIERLIDIDPKEDTNIDSKSIDMIDDLLNEFNERTEDGSKGNQNQLFDFFNVLDDGTKGKMDRKSDLLSDENAKANISIIDALLEQEKEKIDQELRENAIMKASTSESISVSTVTAASSTVTFTTSSSSSTMSNTGFSLSVGASNVTDPNAGKKKEDDHIDFEIPRVGKLMKIRKYFESQEQKKKEQTQVTDKDAAIRIQEKKEPVIEEKPQLQTILVQVSKRKKIEYGPYINKQSLLEGKPKEQEEVSQPQSPLKLFRPKPRPQVPTRRTFNLRARRTKTDFASLANKGSRHSDGKKGLDKNKGSSKDAKGKDASAIKGEENGKAENKNEPEGTDSKIVTRNKAANKDVENSKGNSGKCNIETSGKMKIDKDDKRSALRTRSNKLETSEAETQSSEGKSLRRRIIKPTTEETKVKNTKSNELSSSRESEDLSLRKVLRSKLKTTPEKNDIKKCSVNLGENLSGSKLKAASYTTGDKKMLNLDPGTEKPLENELISDNAIVVEDENKLRNQVKDLGTKEESKEINKDSKTDEIDCIAIDTNGGKIQNENLAQDKEIVKPQADDKNNQTQTNIFEVMSVDMEERKEKVNTDPQPERKVQVIKLKLGSEIQKSLKEIKESLSLSKKRKFENQKDELQRELDTCTKKVSEIQRQIASHKEAESLKRQERSIHGADGLENEQTDDISKKKKHSVENEFQRLVDEAVEAAKKGENAETGKPAGKVNLRRRMNESVKYNVDNTDDEVEINPITVLDPGISTPKSRKLTPKSASKLTPLRFSQKFPGSKNFRKELGFSKPVKKDVDVYDFTDTELSDKEDTSPLKMSSFKPKYVSNVGTLGQKFLTKSSGSFQSGNANSLGGIKVNGDEGGDEISYIGKTVEPLKIKLTKIIPYKEKKHKHKKKKHKKDRERKKVESLDDSDMDGDDDDDDDDDESRESVDEIDSDSCDEGQDSASLNNQTSKKSKLKAKNHICSFCNQAFSQKCDLRKHEMIHTGERPWPCEICDKKFHRKTDLAKHIRTHTGEKPYKCEFCDKRVSDKSQLNVHRRLHTGDRPYQCTQCGKGCITSSELTRHRIVHCTETSHMCKLCKKVFKVKECLGMHMKLHYKSRGKPFKCDKCALGFDDQTLKDHHKCANDLPSLFICSECYAEFAEEQAYADHIKTHNLNVFSCNICTHMFEDKVSLETHLCSIGMDQQKQLQCEFCEKIFQDQATLTKHLPEHDNDVGSFMCESCSQIFTVRKEFVAHSQKHRIGAFICNGCGTGFHDSLSAEAHHEKCFAGRLDNKSVSSTQRQHFGDAAVKSERGVTAPKTRRVSGATRASVISANVNFKSGESELGAEMTVCDGTYPTTVPSRLDNVGLQSAYIKQKTQVPYKVNTVDNSKEYDPLEFCNSPDFSSLTGDPGLSIELNSFQKFKSNKFGSHMEAALGEGQTISAGKGLGIDMMLQSETDSRKAKQFQNITSNLQSSHNSAQSEENQWIGSYQMSANDYVNSLLNKMESGTGSAVPNVSVPSKLSSVKSESQPFSDAFKFQPSNSRIEFKDNIENQAKTDIFSDFDFPVSNQKVSDLYQSVNKHTMDSKFGGGGNSQDRSEYQDVNQTSFVSHPRSTFQEKSDFSSFSNSFLNFPQSSSYSLTGSGSLFGGMGQNPSKQSGSSSLFTEGEDLMDNNYFLGVGESIKGTLPSDKADETAALLSNFDYDLN